MVNVNQGSKRVNFSVFDLTQPAIEAPPFRTRREHFTHYAIETV